MPIMRDPARSAAGTLDLTPAQPKRRAGTLASTAARPGVARIRDTRGSVLAEAEGDAANIHVDFASAVAVMRSVVGEVLRKAGIGAGGKLRVAVGLGLAGLQRRGRRGLCRRGVRGLRLGSRRR